MKIKPILKGLETVANCIVVAGAVKAIYNKFSSSDDEDDEDETDEGYDEEDEN